MAVAGRGHKWLALVEKAAIKSGDRHGMKEFNICAKH
jgi:hypothetical protein